MKKIFVLISIVILLVGTLSLIAIAADDYRVIKLSHVVNEKDSFHVSALKFKEIVEEKTAGKIKIEIHPNAELGDERTLLEGMQMGMIDMGVITNGPIANFLPEIAVFEMPFLFGTPEEAYYVLDGSIGQKVLKDLESIKLYGLAYSERGFRNLTNSVRPVKTAMDVKGLKIRLMENPLYVDTFKSLGANAVPMAWTECLTALSQKTIDGQENPVVVIYSFKLYESQKYMTLDRHTYAPATILMSLKVWDSLSPENQKIFSEAAQTAGDAAREYNNDNEASQLKVIKENGMEVIENPDLNSFREAVKPVYEKYGPKFKGLLEEIQEELDKFRSK
ncbi:MAG: TRAP transporter substrate-binding protein [Candidatus Caldatribacteriota bacterium]|nr:TRAP transporter substrate-binding protein [Candidatus Caldatribacteriota bacterium]